MLSGHGSGTRRGRGIRCGSCGKGCLRCLAVECSFITLWGVGSGWLVRVSPSDTTLTQVEFVTWGLLFSVWLGPLPRSRTSRSIRSAVVSGSSCSHAHDEPACCRELGIRVLVASHHAFELAPPPLPVALREKTVLRARVPETIIHEDRDSRAVEQDVDPSALVSSWRCHVDQEPESPAVQLLP